MAKVETTRFGDGILVGAGGNVRENVRNQFGPRDVGGTVGVLKVEGMEEELVIDFDGELFNTGLVGAKDFVLPAGAVIKAVYVDVEDAFAISGTTPTLLVGTEGSEVTNGFVVSKAILEATGSANLTSTLTGTWDNEVPLAANTTIGFVLGGTGTPALTNAGKARITVQFYRINRAPSPALPGGPALP
jgi:hypothetical protein